MDARFDVIVLGVGGMGSAVLADLARRGAKVCGVEQYGVAHDRGSSHGQTRLIRKGYLEHPNYVPLLDRAYHLWERLESEGGVRLFERCGIIAAGPSRSRVILGQEACYREHDLPHERFDAAEAQRRYPGLSLPEDWTAFFDPLGGFLYVENSVREQIETAQRHGAQLYANECVKTWRPEGSGVVVETDQRRLVADRLVISSGAWAVPLLREIGVDMEIWRKVLFWYDGPSCAELGPERFPGFMVGTGDGTDTLYGFPAIQPWGLKVAEHNIIKKTVDDPAALERQIRPEDEVPVRDFLDRFMPGQWQRRHHAVCMYTMTPDEHFILDLHPTLPQVVIGGGFSGHGFKFAPVVGQVLADLALDGDTALPIDFLRLDRFAGKTSGN
jgi:sarcosine oxidase